MVIKYDYVYINPRLIVLGRLSHVDYGTDENRGVHLGVGNDFNGAYKIANYCVEHQRCKYGVKISEAVKISVD